MRVLLLAPLMAAAACAQTPSETAAQAQAAQASQIGLEKALSGLTRGNTASCIPIVYPDMNSEAFGPTILYRVNRSLVYRTDTTGGCEALARHDVLVVKEYEGRPCQGDIATTVEPVSHAFTGSCSFGPFTEYRRK